MPVLNKTYSDTDLTTIKEEKDIIVQYYIVRKSLNMSGPKLGAQVAHACDIFINYYRTEYQELKAKYPQGGERWLRCKLTESWLSSSRSKVLLQASDSEFERIKNDLDCFVVRDAGLTEIETGSETVLVLFPLYKSECPKIIKRLRLLSSDKELIDSYKCALLLVANDIAFLSEHNITTDGLPLLILNCSDTFGYASADGEEINYLEAKEVLEVSKTDGWPGIVNWIKNHREQNGEPCEIIKPVHDFMLSFKALKNENLNLKQEIIALKAR